MRALVIVIGLAALLWSGYWLIGASRATKGTRDWLDARSVDGWMAGAADIRTRGFPNRFDTTLTEPRLALPSGQAVWSAPFLQILRLSYKPEHAILIYPESQQFSVAGVSFDVRDAKMQASAILDGSALDRANLAAEDLSLVWNARTLTAGSALAAIRGTAARSLSYDLGIVLEAVTINGPQGIVLVDRIALESAMQLSAPLDLSAPDAPAVLQWTIDRLQVVAEGDTARLSGEVSFKPSGPAGTLIVADGGRDAVLRLGVRLGLLTEEELNRLGRDPGLDLTFAIRPGSLRLLNGGSPRTLD